MPRWHTTIIFSLTVLLVARVPYRTFSRTFSNRIYKQAPQSIEMPQHIVDSINESCSSVESLKAEFLATANAMFGPGFVWLVKSTEDGRLHILSTYIAGSPYPQAHYRRQPVDMATETTGVTGGESIDRIRRLAPTNRVGAMGSYSNQKVLAPGGIDIHPILCVNTWEHVWLRDWGVGGKAGFLEAWWDRINWDEVAHNYSQVGPAATRPARSGLGPLAGRG